MSWSWPEWVYGRVGLYTVQGKTIWCKQAFLVAGHIRAAGTRRAGTGPPPRSTGRTSFRSPAAVAARLGLPRQHKARLP